MGKPAIRVIEHKERGETPLVTVAEAAEMLGVNPPLLYKAVREGSIKDAITSGSRVEISRKWVERLIAGEVALAEALAPKSMPNGPGLDVLEAKRKAIDARIASVLAEVAVMECERSELDKQIAALRKT